MTFKLRSLFYVVTCVAALISFILTLGEPSLLFLVPLSLFSIGFILGRRVQLPATGAFVSTSIFWLYVATFPFVLNYVESAKIVNAGNYWKWRAYEWLLVYPTFEVEWFWTIYHAWSKLCSEHPNRAIVVLTACIFLGLAITLWADVKHLGRFLRLKTAIERRNRVAAAIADSSAHTT